VRVQRQGYQLAIAAILAASGLLLPEIALAQLRGGVSSGTPAEPVPGLPTSGPGAIGPGGAAATGTSADAVILSGPSRGAVSRAAPSRASRSVRAISGSGSTRRAVRPPPVPVTGVPFPAANPVTARGRTSTAITGPAPDGLEAYPARPQRPPEEADPYAALGLRVGGVILRPATNDFIGYDTNPNRASGRAKGSGFARGEGELGIQSDWVRHEFTGNLRGGYTRFFSVPDASRPDGEGRLGLRLDLDRETRIDLETRLRVDTQRPGSTELNATAVGRPATYTYGGSAGISHDINRLQLSLRGSVDRSTYEDGKTSTGGTIIQSDRNQTQYGVRLRAGYDLMPGIKPFVEGLVDTRKFDDSVDTSGFRRSSNGVGARVGSTFELTRQLTGEVSVGYQQRKYDDARLRDLRGFVGDAALIWSATPLTTVTLRGTSELSDTTLAGVSGSVTRRASLEISHALLRNFTVTPFATFSQTAYDGSSLREDTTTLGARLDYKLSRSIAVRASFTHERLKSTSAGSDYTANVGQAGLRLQF
jgi:hypothetical protein